MFRKLPGQDTRLHAGTLVAPRSPFDAVALDVLAPPAEVAGYRLRLIAFTRDHLQRHPGFGIRAAFDVDDLGHEGALPNPLASPPDGLGEAHDVGRDECARAFRPVVRWWGVCSHLSTLRWFLAGVKRYSLRVVSAPLPDNRIRHLDFLQAAITRMAGAAASIKNLCLVVIAGALAFIAASKEPNVALYAAGLTAVFWFLDARYLQQEKWFRDM